MKIKNKGKRLLQEHNTGEDQIFFSKFLILMMILRYLQFLRLLNLDICFRNSITNNYTQEQYVLKSELDLFFKGLQPLPQTLVRKFLKLVILNFFLVQPVLATCKGLYCRLSSAIFFKKITFRTTNIKFSHTRSFKL